MNSITITANVSSIGTWAFYMCFNLESITNPESVEIAFSGTGLTSINIPENITYIGSDAFGECMSMTSINVSANNKAFKSNESVLFNYTENELVCYPAGKRGRYFIPFGVETIKKYAFSCCKYLSSITIPISVTEIGSFAFEDCEGLSSIIIPQSIDTLSDYAFFGCINLLSVTYLGATVITNNGNAFIECNKITEVHVLTTYKSNAFCGFTAIKCVYTNLCGTSLSYIFDNYTDVLTIYGVGNMYNYTIDSVPWISFNDHIKSVAISYGVKSIGKNAFSNFTEISSITIPSSVKSIGNSAFYNCLNLGSLIIENGVTSIGNNAFSNCTELSSITIPSSVKFIGYFAFSNCLNLSSVTYNGINDPGIVSNVFDNCNKLIKVNVPANYNGNTFCGKNIIRMQNEPTVTNSNTVIIAIIVSVVVILIITGITVVICFHKKSTSKYEDENVQV